MPSRFATLVRTGKRVETHSLEELYRLARELCPDSFTAEETQALERLREHVAVAYMDRLRRELAEKLDLPIALFDPDRFSIQACGPISLHDDRFRCPNVYFVIVIAHAGCLGVTDTRSEARRHAPGEVLLLDPRKKHALVPDGLRARDYPYERTHSPVRDENTQFLFLDFEVPRPPLRAWFRSQ